jgi:hypothetical protein
VPNVDDAYRLVTDRKLARSATGDPVRMRHGEITRVLLELGARDELSARIMIVEAAHHAGGHTAVSQRKPARAGDPPRRGEFEVWIPAAALRDR